MRSLDRGRLFVDLARERGFPFLAHLFDLRAVVGGGVVVLADTAEPFPERQVLRVHGDTVVFVFAALTDEPPAAFLFLEIETRGIREEEHGDDDTGETEPGHDVELHLRVDVVAQHGGEESTEFAAGGGETVGGGADGSREDFGGDEEGDAVGAELVEEGREEVHGHEFVDVLRRGVVLVVEARHDEEDEAHHETDNLHLAATVQLVVDEERGEIVSDERDTDIAQVPQPVGDERGGVGIDDLDEIGLEELVAVEEDVVGKPATGSGQDARAEVLEGELQRLGVVSGDIALALGLLELVACTTHLVRTEVDEPQRADGRNGEGDTVGPLRGHLGVRWVAAAVVEDEQQENQDGLVEELTPTLHQEGRGDLAATVQAVVTGRDLAGTNRVFHTRSGSHGVFTTDTDTVEEERPDVADHPAVLRDTPGGGQHNQTQEHDQGVLDETPATAEPVTKDTDEDLTDNDAGNFEVVDGGDPGGVADGFFLPAGGEGFLEERFDVADGEEDVSVVVC